LLKKRREKKVDWANEDVLLMNQYEHGSLQVHNSTSHRGSTGMLQTACLMPEK
jgi:hypothetical protein